MMPLSSGKISNSILWLCMIVTAIIFAFFYFSGTAEAPGSDTPAPKQTSLLLNWVNIVLLLSLCVLLIFSLYRFYRKFKEDPRGAWRSLTLFSSLILLLIFTYFLGSNAPVDIPGYDGKENTPAWLKLTDMWLYSIYVLMGVTALAVLAGIIWSYFKKK
ncbi:MAG: hypothetical protein LBJ72_14630 [Dysgonamonadaceae bacterium]|jgi:magnesium-transporting ATPase (P-type)|nr:hypothetical protein [Dysgonamonadaceae bacterium]